MLVVCAPDSYKESMSAPLAASAMADGVRDAMPDATVLQLPMSDGGEGFAAAIAAATGAVWAPVIVPDALGRPIESGYVWAPGARRAVIEMASAAGLEGIAVEERDVRKASTRGVGRLVLSALEMGARHLVIGLGGSATNDGGAGLLDELGVRFMDAAGIELEPVPRPQPCGPAARRLSHRGRLRCDEPPAGRARSQRGVRAAEGGDA